MQWWEGVHSQDRTAEKSEDQGQEKQQQLSTNMQILDISIIWAPRTNARTTISLGLAIVRWKGCTWGDVGIMGAVH